MCQRYYEKSYDNGTAPGTVTDVGAFWCSGACGADGTLVTAIRYAVPKRIGASPTFYAPSDGSTNAWYYQRSGATGVAGTTIFAASQTQCSFYTNFGAAAWAGARMWGHFVVNADF